VPSLLAQSEYLFIEGQIDDLKRLTPIAGIENIDYQPTTRTGEPQAKQGSRNNWLWRQCMRAARHCDKLDALIDVARTRNMECMPPLAENEVMKLALSAWNNTQENRNRFGQHGAYVQFKEAFDMMEHPDALTLLVWLRVNEGPWARLMIPNSWCEKFKWPLRRFQQARNMLIETGHIRLIKPAYSGSPALYQWDD
jgi:hypothetical protein